MSGQSKEYREYMKSDSWERKKRERLKIDGYKCTACGYSAKPNVLKEKYIICLGAGKHRNNQAQQVYTHHKKTQHTKCA